MFFNKEFRIILSYYLILDIVRAFHLIRILKKYKLNMVNIVIKTSFGSLDKNEDIYEEIIMSNKQ